MARKWTQKKAVENPELEMTPMINVVFQLLIFFIVTMKPEDIIARLDVARPAPDPSRKKEEDVQLLEIIVFERGYVMNQRPLKLHGVEERLTRLANYSKNISVIIKCTANSPHARLVRLLDICAKLELKNLSVFSM